VHWAPGIPRALCFQRAKDFWQTSGASRREIAKSYLKAALFEM
jgi:hypothetical protein